MTHLSPTFALPRLPHPIRIPWFGILIITSFGWVNGVVPTYLPNSGIVNWSTVVFAQTTDKVRDYARAVLAIEPIRVNSFKTVQRMMNGTVPSDVCRQGQLPGEVRLICNGFLDDSAKIIRQHNLSISEFNDITQRSKSDPKLMKQIQQELIRLQKQ
jgi:hypothetical protein